MASTLLDRKRVPLHQSIRVKMRQELTASGKHRNPLVAAEQFAPPGKIVDLQPFGNGNINDTFLVTLSADSEAQFILQRINTQVFRQPELVMQNMRTFTEHVCQRLERFLLPSDDLRSTVGHRIWKVPKVLVTQQGTDLWVDADGSYWRGISFIDASESFDTIQTLEHGREVGYALGTFHGLISDLPAEKLADTLVGFHITPRYLQDYQQVLAANPVTQSPEVEYCLKFVEDRQAWVPVLETAKSEGKLPLRPIHGDPKVNNVMIDTTTQRAVSIIDLDTVKPGLVHYDIGDCLRSGCNPQGEETTQWETVWFEPDLCQAILQGYLPQVSAFLTQNDYEYLYDAIRLIAFELGLRFFSDYLAGNVYFKARHPEHNLARALVQFKLTESIESQEGVIRTLIQDMR